MTVDVLAMGVVAFLVSVIYTDFKVDRAQSRQQHENNNVRVILKRVGRRLWPDEVDESEVQ